MEIQDLRRQALGARHYLERLLVVYEAFQSYVEALKSVVIGDTPNPELILQTRERFRLKFEEYQNLFLEWDEGEQNLNAGVAAFLDYPMEFRNNEAAFRTMLMAATEKFRDILEKAARTIRELHEQIALQDGEAKAEEITHVPASALTRLKNADTVVEILSKWAGKAIRFAPWAYEVIRTLHP